MDRTNTDATVKRYHDDEKAELRAYLAYFPATCNFTRRLMALSRLRPYECVYKVWTSEPDRFIVNPIQTNLEPNT